jgi:hypothetical protein
MLKLRMVYTSKQSNIYFQPFLGFSKGPSFADVLAYHYDGRYHTIKRISFDVCSKQTGDRFLKLIFRDIFSSVDFGRFLPHLPVCIIYQLYCILNLTYLTLVK